MKTVSALLLFTLLLFAGSPQAGKPLVIPPDFEIVYNWRAATVPPPYHFEYTIRVIADGRGAVSYFLNYSDSSVWTESLAVPKDTLAKVYGLMNKTGVFSRAWQAASQHPVGGPIQWLRVVAGEKTVSIPSFPRDPGRIQEVYDAIHALVPQPVWDKFSGLREDYIKNYKRPGEK